MIFIVVFMSGDSLPSWRLPNPKAASFKGFLSSSRSAFPNHDHHADNSNVDNDDNHDKEDYKDKQVRFCQCNPSLAMSVDSV